MPEDAPQPEKRGFPWVPILAFLLVAALTWLAVASVQPPLAAPTGAPADRFSAMRALATLREIAKAPHPTGSEENARVREVIVTRLKDLGLAPDVQTATGSFAKPWWGPPYTAATVHNVVARIKGTGGAKAVMLVAHYDSVPGGPGAGDDGSGVVTLLETARALLAGPRTRNDVIVLLTDGEEVRLLGAEAFARGHPWARDVGVFVNFEARGTGGPSLMYETTPGNGWLIRELARSGARVNASSLYADANRHLPTGDSDLSALERAGMQGLNFAFIDGGARYHTVHDDAEHLDPRTLQQHGDAALALARGFGGADLVHDAGPDAVYFSVLGKVLLYPASWAVPLAVVAAILLVAVVVLGFRARRLTFGGLAAGLLVYPIASAVTAGLCQLPWWGLLRARAVPLGSYGMAYNLHAYAVAFVALAIAVFAGVYAVVRPRVRRENLIAGALLWWLALAVMAARFFVGGSYVFLWPLLAAAGTLLLEFLRSEPAPGVQLLVWTPAAAVVLLLAGAAPYLFMMVTTDLMLLVAVPVVLVLGLLLPQVHLVQGRGRWMLPAAGAVVAVAACGWAAAHASYDADHPQGDSLFYALNDDSGRAAWASRDRAPDAWTSQVLAGTTPASLAEYGPFQARYLHREARAVALVPPDAKVLENSVAGDVRTLRVLIRPAPGTRVVWIRVRGAEVLGGIANGVRLPEPKRKAWQLEFTAPPPEGVDLTLSMNVVGELSLVVTDVADGLPAVDGVPLPPRPPQLMRSPSVLFDSSTLVTRTFPLR